MHIWYLLSHLLGGAMLMNAVPHVVKGATGRRFPTPFAKPPGRGLSSAMVNMLWGFANMVAAYLLLWRVGPLDPDGTLDMASFALGMLLLGVQLAWHFGRLEE